jgi:hypothetical protein
VKLLQKCLRITPSATAQKTKTKIITKKNKLNENGALSGLLSSTTDDINSKKQQLDAMGKSPTEATQDLNATMQGIMQLLGEDKGLGKTLKNLSDTLLQLRNQ